MLVRKYSLGTDIFGSGWGGGEGSWFKQREEFHLNASSQTPSADVMGSSGVLIAHHIRPALD